MNPHISGDPMNPFAKVALSVVGLSVAAGSGSLNQERDRSKIPDKHKWNLADMYPSVDAWKAEKERVVKEIPKIEQYKGRLGTASNQLLACLDFSSSLSNSFLSRHFDRSRVWRISRLSMVGRIGGMGSS